MEDLNNLDLLSLVDLLAKNTNDYLKLLNGGAEEQEIAECRKEIRNLTAEIEYRKQKTIADKNDYSPKSRRSRQNIK